ncbi:MAG: vitamin B12 dependent methionine synthase [Holdemanella sp.]|nr:vitamin B12 dependent methionine synthase [Holdemanella sp.]
MIKKQALKYLGYKEYDASMDALLDAYLKELETYITMKVFYKTFSYQNQCIKELNIELDSKDAQIYFDGCNRIMVICATLGMGVERYLRTLQKVDMAKCVIMDALASAYLEVKLDEYEEFIKEERTYRFAPGYGDLPLNLNRMFYETLNLNKQLGLTLTETGLFIPQKSMLGLIGLGKENKTHFCGNCVKYDSCTLRKEGISCWKD